VKEIAIKKLDPAMAARDVDANVAWYDATALTIEGRGWQAAEMESPYDRLPARARGVVRPEVWNLSRHSAGLSVRFETDAPEISARWRLINESLAMDHMPITGVSGVDLYLDRGGEGPAWWLGTGRGVQSVDASAVLVGQLDGQRRRFMLNLPLYNGVDRVEIGISPATSIWPAPARAGGPVVFYGTSIVQGGCASRPGMAYPSIVARALGVETINLGFSGNAQMEPEIARLLAELDARAFVLDPLPNMQGPMIDERAEPFIEILRAAHPDTPIVMMECYPRQNHPFVAESRRVHGERVAAFRRVYDRRASTDDNLHWLDAVGLIGSDGEGTVDGTHPNDLGFSRMARVVADMLKGLI